MTSMRKVAEEVHDLRAVALDAIDATPARWRGDAGSVKIRTRTPRRAFGWGSRACKARAICDST